MSEDIKRIIVKRITHKTESWTINIDPDSNNNKHHIKLIEDLRNEKIGEEEIYYELADSESAIWDEHISYEDFDVVVK